jgi:hypothetical protein
MEKGEVVMVRTVFKEPAMSSRVSLIVCALAVLGLAWATPAQAALLAYEPFDYTSKANLSGQNGGTGFAQNGAPEVPWYSHANNGGFVSVQPAGVVSGVILGDNVTPNPFTATYANLPSSGNYVGMNDGKNVSGRADHLSMWRALAPSVTNSFVNGTKTYISFVSANAFPNNARAPSFAIGAGVLNTFLNGDRGNSTSSVNQLLPTYPDLGTGVAPGYNFDSKEAIVFGADTTNAGTVAGSTPMTIDWVGLYFAQKYDTSGVRTRSGPVGNVGGTYTLSSTAGTLTTAPADHGYWMKGGKGSNAYALLHGYSDANCPSTTQPMGDNASHVNIVVGEIDWGAGTNGGDLVSVYVFHDNDTLDVSAFDSGKVTLDTATPSEKGTYNMLSIAGGKWFADEIRIADNFNEALGVPEPATLAFVVLGGLGILARRRSRRA